MTSDRTSRAAAILGALVFAPLPAAAAGIGLFQHGARATGQAGAFTARASDPSALHYNPAAITRLEGGQFQAGLDFGAPSDDYASPQGAGFSAKHQINFPPALYWTWKSKAPDSRWAVGVGLDTPFWNTTVWRPALFPQATQTREFTLELFELHPVVAYAPDERWSLAAGFSYLAGDLEDANRNLLLAAGSPTFFVFGERSSEAGVDGWRFDLAVHYDREAWGWGAVLRSGVNLEGHARNRVRVDSFVPREFEDEVEVAVNFLLANPDGLGFELPPDLRVGIWGAPYPELRLELDIAFAFWSEVNNSVPRFTPPPFCVLPTGCPGFLERRFWYDTLSVRVGAEGDLTGGWVLAGGLAYEPSPVPSSQLEPGFPRGAAWVYAIGTSYNFPQLSFDLGYSYHDHQSRSDRVGGRYSASEQVFAVSARWRH